MISKVLSFENFSVSYLDNEKDAHLTLLFIHGNSSRKEAFRRQFESSELQAYRLLAVDLPGHGESKSEEQAELNPHTYSYQFYIETIVQFVNELKLQNVVFIGHSLGGHIAIGASSEITLRGLVISQTPPLEEISDSALGFNGELTILATLYNPNASSNEAQAVVDTFAKSDELKSELSESWQMTRAQFRTNFSQSLGASGFVPGEMSKLKSLQCPWIILEAKNDIALNHEYFLTRDLLAKNLIELTGSRHYPQFEDSEAYNRELLRYLKSISES